MLNRLPTDDGRMTHMPFLMRGLDGRKVLFYCAAPNPAEGSTATPVWKVFFLVEGRVPQRLNTRLPEDVCECSPTAWQDETGWHMSFTAGGGMLAPTYRLCRLDAPALEALGADSAPVALQITRTGFVYRDRTVWGEMENVIHVIEGGKEKLLELPGAFLYRLAYRAAAPAKLLITGHWQLDSVDAPADPADGAGLFTVEYDLTTGEQAFLESSGQPVYKPTLLGDEVVHAERQGAHFEYRQLRAVPSLTRRPAQVIVERPAPPEAVQARAPVQTPAISTVPKGNCNCSAGLAVHVKGTTRPSCLECVEKHLGAAYVLLSENVAGYAHRLRAVGHLHEAEDESQAWPDLHAAIRTARKAYQTEATVPDWQALETLIGEVRTGAQ